MPSLGIIVLNLHQEKAYYDSIGAYLAERNVDVYRFTPKAIQPYTEKINGEVFDRENNIWKQETFPIPDYLYDRCFYSTKESFKTNYPIVQWLKNRTTFLGNGLPGKWRVYECLTEDPILKFYTIETLKVTNAGDIIKQLKQHTSLILKPESGSQGNGIFLLQKQNHGITVKTQRGSKIAHKLFATSTDLKVWLSRLLEKTTFLSQPFLSLQNSEGKPFDIRILLEKDELGKWHEGGRGIRIGKKNGVTSNLHGGGSVIHYKDWLKKIHASQRKYVHEEITTIIERIPGFLEQSFGKLVELGLDIGVDKNGAVWILEANSKPGHQVIIKTNPDYTPLRYCSHLFQQKELISNAQPVNTSENKQE